MKLDPRKLGWLAIVCLIVHLVAMVSSSIAGDNSVSPVNPAVPVRVVIMPDKSGSSISHGVPRLDSGSVAILINLLLRYGGEIAVGIIGETSEIPLERLYVSPPPVPPSDSSELETNPFMISKARAIYEKRHQTYQAALTDWQAQAHAAIDAYWPKVMTILSTPSKSKRTDIWNAVRRVDAFLGESDLAFGGPTRKFALLCTDGENTRTAVAPATMKHQATIIMVPGTALGDLASLNPITFENPEAAARFIARVCGYVEGDAAFGKGGDTNE